MKKTIALMTATLLILLTLCFPGVAAEPYKLGVNLELSGPWANVTRTLVMAMELEVKKINEAGGIDGRPLELVIRDNGFDIARASSNMIGFAGDEEILAVVGPFEDTFQAATRSIAERERVTNIIVCPSNPAVRSLRQKWSFNIAHSDKLVADKLTDLCLMRGYQNILVFAGAWPLARSLADHFKAGAEAKGLSVTISPETHLPTDIDVTPQLLKIQPVLKEKKIDAVFASTGGPTGPIICKNMRTLGIDLPILGTHAFGFGFIIGLGGEAMEGVEFPTGKPVVPGQLDADDPARETIQRFNERMQAAYQVGADQIAGHGYDIVHMAADALRRCGSTVTRATFREALENTREFVGCTGIYTYTPEDHDGLGKRDLVFVRITGNRFKRVLPEAVD